MEKQLSFLKNKPSNAGSFGASPHSSPENDSPFPLASHWNIYIDGAARGNPGHAGAGVYVVAGATPTIKKGIYLGIKTNNQAEYLALALALYFINRCCTIHRQPFPTLNFFSDSELLVKQLKGIYKIKNPTLRIIKQTIDKILQNKNYSVTHVYRENNKNADALANEGVDKRTQIPTAFFKFMSDYNPLVIDVI